MSDIKLSIKKQKVDDTVGKLKGKTALKDHHILQNHININIKKGDDLKDIPNRFEPCLKSEKVI